MALPTRRRRPGALLLLLLVGLALAAAFSYAHAVRVPAVLRDGDTKAADHRGQAPAGSGAVPLEHAVDDKQVHEPVSEEVMVMRLSSGSGSGGGSRGGSSSRSSSGSSGGSGSRSGSGSSSGGSRSGGSGSKGGGSRSGGGSRGGGSRSGGGSRGTTNYDSVFDLIDYDNSSAGARGGAWTAGVAATVLAVAWLL